MSRPYKSSGSSEGAISIRSAVMSDSLILTLTGNSSELQARFFPPIELSENKQYVIGLVELLTFNSIPNVDANNNKFHLVDDEVVTIPVGSYELEDIANYLKSVLEPRGVILTLKANNNTLQGIVKCNREIDFRPSDSIASILGFKPQVLVADREHVSDLPVAILKINCLRVECNIATGAYINGQRVRTLHEFFPAVPPGYKIIEAPSQVIYLPLSVNCIDHLQVRVVDQDGDSINFRGEILTIRLHIKST